MELSAPQEIFINQLNTKNTAYVGGFGCVHPDTKIHTEFGLIRISEINRPMRVLSWNERDQRFQLSLSGGSFPKGKGTLYRVVTQQGEFAASEHHRSLSSCGKYLAVSDLCAGDELATFGGIPHSSSLEPFLQSLPLGAQHCSETIADSMGDYADEARLYGQQFLGELDNCKPSLAVEIHHANRSHHHDCNSHESHLSITTVVSIETLGPDVYYDMQVLDTNNYVTEDGCIHHNSGKTFVACLKICIYIGRFPRQRWGFWAPSYPLIRDVFYPTFEEAAELMGFTTKINVGDKEVSVYRGSVYYGTVICRSMSDPSSIVGYKVAGGICDEIDTMKKAKAEDAWRKVNARLRLKVKGLEQNWLGVTTTPEGFNFVYEHFAKAPKSRYSMVQASTYENADFLPDDYIENLYETYPENLISAYLNGEFVNLTSGTVYTGFDRKLNSSDRKLISREAAHIGMDFNVGRMCSVTHVIEKGEPIAVDEFVNAYDTPDMIRQIRERYWIELEQGKWRKTREIYVYPDSSGKNRKSVGASQTDISLLTKAGFKVRYKPSNPPVRDRVNSMNSMFKNARGERRYKVNTKMCPTYTEKLEQQVYKNGEPEKDGTEDVNDAGGYFISYEYGIVKPITNIKVTY